MIAECSHDMRGMDGMGYSTMTKFHIFNLCKLTARQTDRLISSSTDCQLNRLKARQMVSSTDWQLDRLPARQIASPTDASSTDCQINRLKARQIDSSES
jgi:hypothetical protein